MTSKERILTALLGEQPDRVPIFDFVYSRRLYKEVLGRAPECYNSEDAIRCAEKVGFDMVVIPLSGFAGIDGNHSNGNCYDDEWGISYKKDPSSWPASAPIAFPLKEPSDWAAYRLPDPKDPKRVSDIKVGVQLGKELELSVIGALRGPFSAAWLLFGLERFCLLLYDRPDIVDETLKAVTDFYISAGHQIMKQGVDGLLIADDYGSTEASMISPELFRKHIVPQISRMVGSFKSKNIPIIMHSDGNLNSLIGDIVSTGVHAYHPIQRKAHMDLAHVKQNYGKELCLIGNVDNASTLVTGSVDDVKAETIECLRVGAHGGGYILASDHSLHDDIPNENIFVMVETGLKYGKYPLALDSVKI